MVRWYEFHDIGDTIANKGLESAWITIKPAEDNCAISPGEHIGEWDLRHILNVV